MKKKLVIVLFVLTPFMLFSQEFSHNRTSIGLNMGYNEYEGLIVGTELSVPISKRFFINGRIKTSMGSLITENDYGFQFYLRPTPYITSSIGLGYVKKISNKIDFNFGVQYQYKKYWNSAGFYHSENQNSIILPFDIVFHVNKRFAIKAGFSPKFNLKHSGSRRFRFCSDPHLSFTYKF